MVSEAAIKAGFGAGLLEDDPETKSAKTYLVLTVGGGDLHGDITGIVKGMDGVDVMDSRKKTGKKGRDADRIKGSRAWIMRKKEQMERKGKVVKNTSKYTGRKRPQAF
jgi:18S rRNA (guanine1575-N7)-methyltransferase